MKNYNKQTAREILEYCISYLSNETINDFKIKNKKLYKDMVKEIEFMITTD